MVDPNTPASTSPGLTVPQAAERMAGLLTLTGTEEASPPPQDAVSEPPPPDGEPPAEPLAEEPPAEPQPEDQPPAPALYTVTIDGTPEQVTLDEALKGYMRQKDYTHKTQAAAELRKQAEATAATAHTQREQYAQLLTQLRSTLEALTPAEPDWDAVKRDRPAEYGMLYADWQRQRDRMQTVRAEEARVAEEARQAALQQQTAKLAEERERVRQVIPEWRNPTVASQELAEMVQTAKAYEFTDQEIALVSDARTVRLLRDAMLWRRFQAKKPGAQARIADVRTATPGARSAPQGNVAQQRAREQLAKSGKVRDAAKLFEHLIPD